MVALQDSWYRLKANPQSVNHSQFVATDTERLARSSRADHTQARLAIMFDIACTWEVRLKMDVGMRGPGFFAEGSLYSNLGCIQGTE